MSSNEPPASSEEHISYVGRGQDQVPVMKDDSEFPGPSNFADSGAHGPGEDAKAHEDEGGEGGAPDEGPSQSEALEHWRSQNSAAAREAGLTAEARARIPCQWYTAPSGSCRKGSRCPYRHDPLLRQQAFERQFFNSDDGWSLRTRAQLQNRGGNNKLYLPPPAQSLLKQLVRDQIRAEHTQILQALEFLVSERFFEDRVAIPLKPEAALQ